MHKCRYTYLKPILGFLLILYSLSVSAQTVIEAPVLDIGIGDFVCGSSGNEVFHFKWNIVNQKFDEDDELVRIQMSDKNGSFDNPLDVGFTDSYDHTMPFNDFDGSFLLPSGTAGDGYKIRLVSSSDPTIISAESSSFSAYYEILPDGENFTINGQVDPVLCGGSVTVSVDEIAGINLEDYRFTWYRDFEPVTGLDVNGHTLTITEEGRYYVVFDQGICNDSAERSRFIDVTSIGVDDFEISDVGTIEICSNETYEFVSTLDNDEYIYKWFKDGEPIEGLSDYQVSYETDNFDQYGVYHLVIEAGGCPVSSDFITIAPKEGAGFTITVNTVGSDETSLTRVLLPTETLEFNVVVDPNSSDLSYQWYQNGEKLTANTLEGINIVESGEYFVEVTDNSSECSVALSSEVYTILKAESLVPEIRTSLSYEECNSPSTSLSVVGVKVLANDGNQYELSANQLELASFSYQWFKGGLAIEEETSDGYDVVSYEENGLYSLFTSIGGGVSVLEGTSNELNVLLSPGTEIISSSVSNNLCPGTVINLSIEPLDGFIYTWFKVEDDGDVVLDLEDPHSLDVTEVGDYYVSYTGFDCLNETERINVVEFEEDALQVSPSTTAVLIEGETTILSASGADSYEWYSQNGILLSTNETLEVTDEGVYTLIGGVGDCSVEKEINVVPDDGSFTIPNIITPFNGDGVNDTWGIPNKFSFQTDVQVLIYNSKGDEVFNTFDYQNNWPEDNNIRSGMLFYFKVIKEDNLIKAGTISVLE